MIKKIITLSAIILIYSCATVQSPTGGDKDEKAPILYESSPKDQSTNFQGKEIKLFFNEWMKLEQLQNELIITPREDIKYEASLSKQELVIELEEPLKDSTTYTFNFRKSLKDITEGNLWENPVIAFSTGPYLDSLALSGTVSNIKNNNPQEAFIVGLYSASYDTANLRQGKPVYFTTTDKNGQYQMNNLKAGDYKLYTFKDQNDDLLNNSQAEPFGFHHQIIPLYDSVANINLQTYQRNEDTLKLKKYSPVGKDFIIQYNKGLQKYKLINPKDSSQHIYANNIESSKYLKLYKENFPKVVPQKDSTLLIIQATDSIGKSIMDTVYFQTRESRITNDTIKIQEIPDSKILSGQQQFTVGLSKPVHAINYDSIQLRIDSIPIYQFKREDISLNYNKKVVYLSANIDKISIQDQIDSLKALLKQRASSRDSMSAAPLGDTTSVNQNAENDRTITSNEITRSGSTRQTGELALYLGKSAFMGIENDSTSRKSIPLSFKDKDKYGTITGKIIAADFPFVIELLNKQYEVVDTLVNQSDFKFDYVNPGDYRLRLIKDHNNNQKWDAGNPLLLQKAEEYIFYNELITLKANWEVIDKNFDFSVDNEVDNGVKTDDL